MRVDRWATTRTRSRWGRADRWWSRTFYCLKKWRTSIASEFQSAWCMRKAPAPTGTLSAQARYSAAKLFSAVGKKTPTFLRFSTVGGEKGSADTERDPRGFALKFY